MPPSPYATSAAPRASEQAEDPVNGETVEEARVRNAILEAVLSHQLPPGTRLVESPLCEAFGVNRSLLRRVFVQLANEKVIELQRNRGAVVAQPTQEEMRQAFEARRLIEGAVLQALADRAQGPYLASVRRLVCEEHDAYRKGDRSRWVRLSGEYHLRLTALLGNQDLDAMLKSLVTRTTLMKALYDSPGRSTCSFDEHNAILDALEAGNVDLACKLMSDHLNDAERKLRRDPDATEVDLLALFRPAR
ncbi:MAG: GntR family transcriptional regulator [Burkholderiaceae bacterium]